MQEKLIAPVCPYIEPKELASQADCHVLVDVRSPLEFETEHIKNSINLPLDSLESHLSEIPSDGQLVVICRSGKRAERGAFALLSKGLKPVVLQGGLLAWRKAGLSVKEGKKRLSIERQIQLVVGVGVLTGTLLGAFVNPIFLFIPGFFGVGLTFAGCSGTCALGIILSKAPWNKLEIPSKENKNENKSCCS